MDALFALLRLGLGTEKASNDNIALFCQLTESNWLSLKETAEKQCVSAIVLDGINELISKGDDTFHKGVSKDRWKTFQLQWTGEMLLIEQANLHQIAVMKQMANIWLAAGLKVMLMKGQANGILYPKPLHRSPGDIDCYLFDGYEKGNETARQNGAKLDESWYKHSVIRYQEETFENHRFFAHTREGRKSKRLQRELEETLKINEWDLFPKSNIRLPHAQWNAMFLTYHACAHFLTEGLRLKQVLDWAMFLQKEQGNVDWERFYAFCDQYHLRRFAVAITAICVNQLGIQITNPTITTESPYGDKILYSALYDDDYIYSTGEPRWIGRLHLVKSLFKYRWKYEEIYQECIFKQLWWYASGYLFHTEKQ